MTFHDDNTATEEDGGGGDRITTAVVFISIEWDSTFPGLNGPSPSFFREQISDTFNTNTLVIS